MKKLAIGVLSAGVLAVAGGLGTSYYVGVRIQQVLQDTASMWSSEDGVTVRILEYHRGITQSHAQTLWSLAAGEDTYDLTVTHDIVHGPWPMGQAAQVVSRFMLPPDSEPQLLEALQQHPPLEWTTTASWSGATKHTLYSPNFTAQFEDGSVLTWGGLKAQWNLSAQRHAASGLVQMPALRVKVEEGTSMDLEDAEFTFDVHIPASLNFWNGPSTLQVGKLTVRDMQEQSQWQMQGIGIQLDSSLQDNRVQMALDSSIAKVELPEFTLGDLALEMQAKHINADWLSAFMLWMQRHSEDDGLSAALLNNLPALLASKPEIAVTRFGLQTPEGAAEMSASIAYVGPEPDAFNPLTDLHVQMHAQLPHTILSQLLDIKVRNDYLALLEQLGQSFDEAELQAAVDDGVGKRLKSLLDLGAIQDKGMAFSTNIELKQGELTLNGQPTELRHLLQMGGAI